VRAMRAADEREEPPRPRMPSGTSGRTPGARRRPGSCPSSLLRVWPPANVGGNHPAEGKTHASRELACTEHTRCGERLGPSASERGRGGAGSGGSACLPNRVDRVRLDRSAASPAVTSTAWSIVAGASLSQCASQRRAHVVCISGCLTVGVATGQSGGLRSGRPRPPDRRRSRPASRRRAPRRRHRRSVPRAWLA
jgi:hypothetical protein